MNGEEADAAIRSQEEPAQQRPKKLLLVHSRTAQTRADALRPRYDQRSRRRATAKPEALKALYDAFEWIRGGNRAPGGFKRARPDIAIGIVYDIAVQLAETCRDARVVGPALHVPQPEHPPRHGKIADGVLARNVAESLTAVVAQGHALDRDLAAATGTPPLPALKEWSDSVRNSGAGFNLHGAYLEELMERLPE
ncbi:hypothetical protein [Streptomyces fuscichromogenes]|nr:hypothetical protein [Streptomyces fuscichromogenes]